MIYLHRILLNIWTSTIMPCFLWSFHFRLAFSYIHFERSPTPRNNFYLHSGFCRSHTWHIYLSRFFPISLHPLVRWRGSSIYLPLPLMIRGVGLDVSLVAFLPFFSLVFLFLHIRAYFIISHVLSS